MNVTEDNRATAPRTCQDCGQLLNATPDGSETADDAADLDWTDFCPSPDCPVKLGEAAG